MAINATNYEGTKDYKIAEVGDVYHPNLVVNGDFQVNQRGTTSYSGVGYTVDMWRLMTSTSKLSVVSNGVNINGTNNELCQIIPNRIDITKATIALSINGTRYTHTFTGISSSYQNFSFGSVVVKIKNDSGNIYLHVNCSTAFTLNYVNLFEGEVAYSHVKEEYVLAYRRCLSWLEIAKRNAVSTSAYFMGGIDFLVPKATKPTVTIVSVQNTDIGYVENPVAINISEYGVEYIAKQSASVVDKGTRNWSVSYVATCEPL